MERLIVPQITDILYRLRKGQSERAIARDLHLSRDAVRHYHDFAKKHHLLDAGMGLPEETTLAALLGPPPSPPGKPSRLEPYRAVIEAFLKDNVEKRVIYQRLVDSHGYDGSYSALCRYADKVHPKDVGVTVRVETAPGEQAQVDFGAVGKVRDPKTGRERTAVGLDGTGQTVLLVYGDQDSPARVDIVRALPPGVRGTGVKAELTKKFRAFVKPPSGGGGAGHKAKQTPPIQLGTSGGWRSDLANGYCCGGTLGALVQVNGMQYILSNYHVFEADIVNGGNGTLAKTGDEVIQPGLIDVGCFAGNAQNVGTLVKLGALPGSNVDCSVAQVLPGMVRPDGAILGIGNFV